MNRIRNLTLQDDVQTAMSWLSTQTEAALELAIAIQQIPAPTFAESERADYVKQLFTQLELRDVSIDEVGNVYGCLPGRHPEREVVVVSAHLDTVFSVATDLTVRHAPPLVYGPGLGDNSLGVAGLIFLVRALQAGRCRPDKDIWLVANVGEEGLGDLLGMRAVVDRFADTATYIVLEGGGYGRIIHQAIGVRRFQINVTGPGGHSWSDFGVPSAIHGLSELLARLVSLSVPKQPRTTFNVGLISGGTAVNVIAESASLVLDLRSEEPEILAALVAEVESRIALVKQNNTALSWEVVSVGNRPAGKCAPTTPVVVWAAEALHYVGCTQIQYPQSSTDANIPLSRGYEAVCLGLTHTGNAHRLNEYINPENLAAGLSQLLLVAVAAGGV